MVKLRNPAVRNNLSHICGEKGSLSSRYSGRRCVVSKAATRLGITTDDLERSHDQPGNTSRLWWLAGRCLFSRPNSEDGARPYSRLLKIAAEPQRGRMAARVPIYLAATTGGAGGAGWADFTASD